MIDRGVDVGGARAMRLKPPDPPDRKEMTMSTERCGRNGDECSTMAPAQDAARQGKVGDVSFRPAMDLYDLPDRYQIELEIPGASADGIELTVHESVLSVEARIAPRYREGITPVRGEFGVGDYRRQIRLGEDVDRDALSAAYADGVLTVMLPKRSERTPRRIEVRSA
ncbi:MAG: Hsp20/alpha crystallin family protein [Phycisphaerales bacterium]